MAKWLVVLPLGGVMLLGALTEPVLVLAVVPAAFVVGLIRVVQETVQPAHARLWLRPWTSRNGPGSPRDLSLVESKRTS